MVFSNSQQTLTRFLVGLKIHFKILCTGLCSSTVDVQVYITYYLVITMKWSPGIHTPLLLLLLLYTPFSINNTIIIFLCHLLITIIIIHTTFLFASRSVGLQIMLIIDFHVTTPDGNCARHSAAYHREWCTSVGEKELCPWIVLNSDLRSTSSMR